MKICLVGYGISNKKLVNELLKESNEIFVSQDKEFLEEDKLFFKFNNIKFEEKHGDLLKNCDLAIVSPGINPQSLPAKIIFDNNIEYTTEIEYSWQKIKRSNREAIFLGVTGTDGKSTTTSLLGHILKYNDPLTFVGGNLGTPLIEAPKDLKNYVLEVSSFQIFWSKNFFTDIATLINLAPDHLNWHKDLKDYYETKTRMLKRTLKAGGIIVVNEDTLKDISLEYFVNKNILTFSKNMYDGKYIRYLNKSVKIENESFEVDTLKEDLVAAIVTALNLGISERVIEEAVATFKPLNFRLQLIDQFDSIKFYNDSKATNVHSAYSAYKCFRNNSYVAILSGIPKNEDLSILIEELKIYAKLVIVCGEMEKEVKKYDINDKFVFKKNLEEVFLYLSEVCEPGDNVVFSPAGASFDLYKNYEERGKHFNFLVDEFKRGYYEKF